MRFVMRLPPMTLPPRCSHGIVFFERQDREGPNVVRGARKVRRASTFNNVAYTQENSVRINVTMQGLALLARIYHPCPAVLSA